MTREKQASAAASFIREKIGDGPVMAIILGSGLSQMLDHVEIIHRIPYSDIPYYPRPTVEGHAGEWIFARSGSDRIAFLSGRFHYYEGYGWEELVFPVDVLACLGVRTLIISNACGSTNPDYQKGDIVLITDHLNLLPLEVPLRAAPFKPDCIYPIALIDDIYNEHCERGAPVQKGVYCVLQGPTLETKAEYIWLYRIGADVVGMSSVPEAMEAARKDILPIMISVVTDVGYPPEKVEFTTHEDVLTIARDAAGGVWSIIRSCIDRIVHDN